MTAIPTTSTASSLPARGQPGVLEGAGSDRWPWYGLGAGVLAIAGTTVLNAPFIDDAEVYAAGPEAVFALLSGQVLVQLGAAAGYLAAALLVPFGIGLVATLWRRVPERADLVIALGAALLAGVATTVSGFMMKSVLASGLPGHGDSAFYTQVDTAVAYTFANQLQYAGFLPVVAAAGLLGVLAVRHHAMPRWLGLFSLVLAGGVALVTVVLNLPWSSGLAVPLWLVAVSIAGLRGRRAA